MENSGGEFGRKYRPVVPGLVAGDGPYRLMGARCRHCGTTAIKKAAVCPNCWAADAQDLLVLSNEGHLYAYTVVRNPPPGMKGPYAVAYVDLPENLRLVGRASVETLQSVRKGDRVEIGVAAIGEDADGTLVLAPVIRGLVRAAP